MRKVKWGVLGAGGIADRRTLPGMLLAENCEIAAVMEIDPDHAERLRAKYGARSAYADEDALLADELVEAVYIASPVSCHARQAEKAIRAGKHVLIEKPVALSAENSLALCALAKKSGLRMASGLMMRFNTHHQEIRRLIERGALGRIVSCRAQFTCWYPDIPGSWRQQKALAGGGALTDMGIHCLDLIEYLTGARIRRVGGLCGTLTFRYDVEDSCWALFELDSGAFGAVDVNFNIPDDAAPCRLEIYGTGGSVRAEGSIGQEDGGDVRVVLSGEGAGYDALQSRAPTCSRRLTGTLGNLYAREIASFGESILTDRPVEVPAEDAARLQMVIEAVYRSAQTGAFIDL